MNNNPAYVYIICRLDLPHPILSVQACHAALAATIAFGEPHRTHPNLVLCGVANEAELITAFNRLKELGTRCCEWREEDLQGQATAIATAPLRGAERKPLKRFRLLKPT